MLTIYDNNVNGIYKRATDMIREWEKHVSLGDLLHRRPSRYGDVIEFTSPVASVYEAPWQCVLLDAGRNANPWLHMMEALWCLAGRNDAAFSARYAKRMLEFSDDGVTRHGAYGDRWRQHFLMPDLSKLSGESSCYDSDQLEACVQLLKGDHDERRAVLTMWDPRVDLGRKGKDLPCNTHVYLKVRQGKLIATVCCRSNDLIWGAYGANAVEFAFLMTYVAARLGVEVGRLTQVSDSLHVYDKTWTPLPVSEPVRVYPGTRPLCDVPEKFIEECERFCNYDFAAPGWANTFFLLTAMPMKAAWDLWKTGAVNDAIITADTIAAPDWREACVKWLSRRREAKKESA